MIKKIKKNFKFNEYNHSLSLLLLNNFIKIKFITQ